MLLPRLSQALKESSQVHFKLPFPPFLLVPSQVGRLPFVGDISDVYSLCIGQGIKGGVRAPERVVRVKAGPRNCQSIQTCLYFVLSPGPPYSYKGLLLTDCSFFLIYSLSLSHNSNTQLQTPYYSASGK